MSGMLVSVYLAWAMIAVMSSRIYLNLVLAANGGRMDGVTTGGLPSFRAGQGNQPEGTEGEVEHVTFGAKLNHSHVPLTTFSTVSLYLFSVPSLPGISYHGLPLYILSRRLSGLITIRHQIPNRTFRREGSEGCHCWRDFAPVEKIFDVYCLQLLTSLTAREIVLLYYTQYCFGSTGVKSIP
jgi:hypothetical protein